MTSSRPLSVAVLLDLVRTPQSGGHVKCWEQFARAAAGVADLDLTIYVLGDEPGAEPVADNVRFVALRPVLSTGPVRGLVGGVDDSDLAPYHPELARRLPRHAVWHLTHSMTFAGTALRLARRGRRPLTASVHTDVPTLTRMYTRQIVRSLPGALRSVTHALGVDRRAAELTRRRRDRILRSCSHVLASNPADAAEFAGVAPQARVSILRRGVDTELFRPRPGQRGQLRRRFGLPDTDLLVLFAGRIDVTKGAPLVAEAVRRLLADGVAVHLVMAGTGAAAEPVAQLLGPHVTLLGHLPQDELARLYAACDVMAFPSRSETVGNVVAEAMASGLPVLLPEGERTAQWLAAPGQDGILVPGSDPAAWAAALRAVSDTPARRERLRACARRTIERRVPSWRDVLGEDLLPVWREAGRAAAAGGSARAVPVGVSG